MEAAPPGGGNGVERFLRNLFITRFALRRAFPDPALARIEEAVRASESQHGGEVRVAIETSLDLGTLLRGRTARERAIQAFSELRVWDTEYNNGVLVYLLLSERDVEIVADRGYEGRVGEPEWQYVCERMRPELEQGWYEKGVVTGIEMITVIISRHFSRVQRDIDELPNRPRIL